MYRADYFSQFLFSAYYIARTHRMQVMYYLIFLIFLIALFFILLFHTKRKKIIAKICKMEKTEKCFLLNEVVKPFGYCYHCSCGFFSTIWDAWQKDFGYTYLFDKTAPRFQMVFQCEPIYFDYDGKTWLIEFWKGQYGINTGAEIGVYHADRIIPPEDYKKTVFFGARENEMLNLSILLYNEKGRYVWIQEKHWWLTAFLTGCFSNPADLFLETSITFPDYEMLDAFVLGMYEAGYCAKDFYVFGLKVTFTFFSPKNEETTFFTRFLCRFAQWKNRFFCKLYIWVTKPFCQTEDRILYLYYHLPFIFRKTLRLHRFQKKKKCHRRNKK